MRRLKRSIAALAAVGAVGVPTLAAPAALAAPPKPKVAAVVQERAVLEKRWTWGELHRGDCQQNNGTLVIRSDGTGDWSATTLTYHTHSGDIWHSSFNFYTTAGFHLFSAGTFDSPRMDDGNPPPRYNWSAHFTFDPSEFNGVARVTQSSSC